MAPFDSTRTLSCDKTPLRHTLPRQTSPFLDLDGTTAPCEAHTALASIPAHRMSRRPIRNALPRIRFPTWAFHSCTAPGDAPRFSSAMAAHRIDGYVDKPVQQVADGLGRAGHHELGGFLIHPIGGQRLSGVQRLLEPSLKIICQYVDRFWVYVPQR